MAKTIRVGIVGCGKIATVGHVPGYLQAKRAEVAGLFDPVRARTEKMKKTLAPDAEVFATYEDMLDSDIDAVSICTPNSLHCPQTVDALKAGKHVLCDKPMAGTLADATKMVKAAEKAGKVLQINQSLRYHPIYVTMADQVAKGKIGQPQHVRCIRAGASSPNKGWSPGADWFVSAKHQGGLVLDIGIHMADIMRHIAGDEIVSIAALVDTREKTIDVPDNVSALMRFAGGATGILELSWTMPVGAGLFEVYGTKGTLRHGFSSGDIELLTPGAKGPKVKKVPLKKNVKTSYEVFADACLGRGQSPTDGEMGREALALCDAILRSGKQGGFQKVKTY